MLVGIEALQDVIEDRVRGGRVHLEIAVKFKQFWEKRKNEGEGYLGG